ncbi:MAG: hypothetical protein KJO40_06940 [Deltaproteobacteria bacterium]|nr:hypothetical protein [Deltaproteobacteria bacterium]NND28932.1 hypothetical protein [Myxococcales bacterium]MBT8464441.1 hypothetical protein [Deltaproteobacteria bacterium]MBT8480717.1 hypothetical protein [Deltaproteobacteria bacterium]NNK08425.1 hypothetical protein [Myxococcales bacterium]
MKNRLTMFGFASCLLIVLTGGDCNTGGLEYAQRAGPWGSSTLELVTCFYVSQDGSQLLPNAQCNLGAVPGNAFAFEMQAEESAGVDQEGNDCGFGVGYEEPVPIVNDSFAVEGYKPSVGSEEISFNGTFDGNSASGTTTKVDGQSRCDIEWTAMKMQGGTGGTGGAGDLGAACETDNDCDPNASSLGVYCCTEDAATCGDNLGECVEDCSTFSSGGEVGMFEGALCENNNECGQGFFCCLVPDAAGNCNFGLDQSCTCRSRSAVTDCSSVTPGDGGFGAPCRNDGDCSEGLPCCTSTAVSPACGVEVGLCECI